MEHSALWNQKKRAAQEEKEVNVIKGLIKRADRLQEEVDKGKDNGSGLMCEGAVGVEATKKVAVDVMPHPGLFIKTIGGLPKINEYFKECESIVVKSKSVKNPVNKSQNIIFLKEWAKLIWTSLFSLNSKCRLKDNNELDDVKGIEMFFKHCLPFFITTEDIAIFKSILMSESKEYDLSNIELSHFELKKGRWQLKSDPNGAHRCAVVIFLLEYVNSILLGWGNDTCRASFAKDSRPLQLYIICKCIGDSRLLDWAPNDKLQDLLKKTVYPMGHDKPESMTSDVMGKPDWELIQEYLTIGLVMEKDVAQDAGAAEKEKEKEKEKDEGKEAAAGACAGVAAGAVAAQEKDEGKEEKAAEKDKKDKKGEGKPPGSSRLNGAALVFNPKPPPPPPKPPPMCLQVMAILKASGAVAGAGAVGAEKKEARQSMFLQVQEQLREEEESAERAGAGAVAAE